jgi:ribosomal protein S18 acetylase RimI-like enzyme
MHLQITNSTPSDLSTIFEFYDYAVAHQKKVGMQTWKGFDDALIKKEINEQRQYKILVDEKVACVFVVTFNDPQIWLERSNDKAIYLHRIVTHPDFRGLGFVQHITDWAIEFSKNRGLDFVRMDTWADNPKLVSYYKSFGYKDAGTIQITADSGLPKHYEGITLQLFEIGISCQSEPASNL